MCPSCQLISGWSTIEKFLPRPKKLTNEQEKLKELFLKSKPNINSTIIPPHVKCISNLENDVVVKVMETLELQAIPHNVLTHFSAMIDLRSSELYFPLKDVNGAIVGYKRLSKVGNDVVEETFPEAESFGLVKSQAIKKDFPTAILVLSIVDMLALATQKINCKYFFHC